MCVVPHADVNRVRSRVDKQGGHKHSSYARPPHGGVQDEKRRAE